MNSRRRSVPAALFAAAMLIAAPVLAAGEAFEVSSDISVKAAFLYMLPVLTVGDGKGFSHAGGIIELFVEGGKMRFAINMDAAERAGLHLSSRLLGLAKVVRDGQ